MNVNRNAIKAPYFDQLFDIYIESGGGRSEQGGLGRVGEGWYAVYIVRVPWTL